MSLIQMFNFPVAIVILFNLCVVLCIHLQITDNGKQPTTISNSQLTPRNPLYTKKRTRRSVFLLKKNGNERYIIEGEEKQATNRSRPYPRPRFAVTGSKQLPLNPSAYACYDKSDPKCWAKTGEFRKIITEFLVKSLERNVTEPNYYNVKFNGYRAMGNVVNPICLVQEAGVKVLRQKDSLFKRHTLGKLFPKKNLFNKKKKKSCAVVTSAGSLLGSNLGKKIDDHDIVMRFNHAPVEGYEADVGSKTTIRVVNSQVVTKPEFNFLGSEIFQNVKIAAWDPGKYNDTLDDWLNNVDFDLFTNYEKFRKKYPKTQAYIINPRTVWKLWTALQIYLPYSIRKNPPSSGFIGIALLFPYCYEINIFEYIPSTRMTGLCHYFNKEINSACTFGAWHPLAAEKLMTLHMNSEYDMFVFQTGMARITELSDRLYCSPMHSILFDPLIDWE